MGLDMYLYATAYIKDYSDNENSRAAQVAKVMGVTGFPVTHVAVEVGYWRKAKAVHAWFVRNVQDGNDNGGDYYVSSNNLKELRELCVRVLANRDEAPALLPAQAGCFFGSTDYDEGYFEDLQHTVRVIDAALRDDSGLDGFDFMYHSS